MKFENTRVMNFENAIYGMRNPKESWCKIDSIFWINSIDCKYEDLIEVATHWTVESGFTDMKTTEYYDKLNEYKQWLDKNGILEQKEDLVEYAFIGPKDMKLMQTLIKAGSEHRKFMRQIFVSVDITAPMYWWGEFDTYKVGTVANSTSKMHTLTNKPITLDCFEIDDYQPDLEYWADEDDNFPISDIVADLSRRIIGELEELRKKYLETNDKRYWKELIRWLPESWLQTRTVTMNYENLLTMCGKGQRRFHKLNEWSGQDNSDVPNFISWARTLPYAQELIFIDEVIDE